MQDLPNDEIDDNGDEQDLPDELHEATGISGYDGIIVSGIHMESGHFYQRKNGLQ